MNNERNKMESKDEVFEIIYQAIDARVASGMSIDEAIPHCGDAQTTDMLKLAYHISRKTEFVEALMNHVFEKSYNPGGSDA